MPAPGPAAAGRILPGMRRSSGIWDAATMIELNPRPCHEVAGVNVVDGTVSRVRYPVLEGRTAVMPAGLAALVVVSDLQGRGVPSRYQAEEPPLVGTVIAADVAGWLRERRGIDPADCGVILPGDYWSWPPATGKRGGYGDVRPVWDAFADRFRWVVGVPGNHDLFESTAQSPPACESWRSNVHLLNCGTVSLGGLVLGGVGGCVGNPKRPFRFAARDQESRLLDVMAQQPDILIVHQGPVGHGRERPGAALVEEILRLTARPTLVLCGHEHWDYRLVDVGACRVLNAHETVCILGRLEDSSD